MQIPLKVNKVNFFDIKHGLRMTFRIFFTKNKNYAIPMHGLQFPYSRRAMDKGKIEAMVTKFSEKFAIIMLKKHRKFCSCVLTHLDAKPTFKICPNTYAPPCRSSLQISKISEIDI